MTKLTVAAAGIAIALLIGAGPTSAPAAEWRATQDLRISARLLADGRLEFALQQRTGGDWGERLLPSQRFFPADPVPGQWLVTSSIALDASTDGLEFRIIARRLAGGRTEAALQSRTTGAWGERRPPGHWFFPLDAPIGRWHSSEVIPGGTGASGQPRAARYRGSPVDARLLGSVDAPVRIVAYEDFACSFCRAFGRDIIPVLAEEYIRAGTVSLEYRHMAILGEYSQAAAAASECAADQDLFWPYHDALIETSSDAFKRIARDLNAELDGAPFDLAAFDACVESRRFEVAVSDATAAARALLAELGASPIGVPTFMVNGELWRVGLQTIEDFRAEIERTRAATPGRE